MAIAIAMGLLTFARAGAPGSSGSPAPSAVPGRAAPPAPPLATATSRPVTGLPPVAALTVVWVPPDDFVRGAEMWPGCTFSFDFGPTGGGITWRTCAGPERPSEPLRTLYAKAGASVSIENSTFTPSTRPGTPAVACGAFGPAGTFVADPGCRVSYAPGQRGEFTFGLPSVPGRWVLSVQGCLAFEVSACGAWYANVDTIDRPPAP